MVWYNMASLAWYGMAWHGMTPDQDNSPCTPTLPSAPSRPKFCNSENCCGSENAIPPKLFCDMEGRRGNFR